MPSLLHLLRFGGGCIYAILSGIMNCLVWNCRGLGNPEAVQALKWQLGHKSPGFVFLMETKLLQLEVERLARDLSFDDFLSVNCDTDNQGRRGGLVMFWRPEMSVTVLSTSLHHINVEIRGSSQDLPCRFSGVYGWSEVQQKENTWDLLRSLSSEGSSCWLCAGDFNEILYHHEKCGGCSREPGQIEKFRDAVQCCNLDDLGYRGYKFTWSNMREGNKNVHERLDQFFL
ncbi:hypothetical protein C2S51_001113 [Perilla frutescens var. frutescens]|nr:hypothetical protein C2S51_001113 [Perilla frutescens var. frutescens]